MAIWSLLAAAAPSIISGIGQMFNKPKKSDYAADTGYMDKYIASMRGRQSSREVYHMAMQPALRAIGQQQRKTQRQIGYGVERAGLTGSGIEAQQRLSAGQMGLEAIQKAGESATQAQMTESRRLGQQVDAAEMQRGQMISAGEKAYEQAQTQWRQGLVSTALSGVGAVAGAKFGEMAATQKLATEKAEAGTAAYEGAKAAGHFTGTGAEFTAKAKAAGYTDLAMYAESLKTAAKPGAAAFKTATKAIDAFQKEGTNTQALQIVNEMTKSNFKSLADASGADVDWEIVAGKVKTGAKAGETKLSIEKQGANIRSTLDVIGETFETKDIGGDLSTGALPPIRTRINDAISTASRAGGMDAATRTKVLADIQEYVNSLEGAALKKSNLLVIDADTGGGIKVRDKATLNKYFQRMIDKIPGLETNAASFGGTDKKQPAKKTTYEDPIGAAKKTMPSTPYTGDPGYEREPPGYGKGQFYEPTPPSGTAQDVPGGISSSDEVSYLIDGVPVTEDAYQQTLRAMADKNIAERYKQATVDPATQRYMDAQKETKKLPPTTEEYRSKAGELLKRAEKEKDVSLFEQFAKKRREGIRTQEEQFPFAAPEEKPAVSLAKPKEQPTLSRQKLIDLQKGEGITKQLPTSLERRTMQMQQAPAEAPTPAEAKTPVEALTKESYAAIKGLGFRASIVAGENRKEADLHVLKETVKRFTLNPIGRSGNDKESFLRDYNAVKEMKKKLEGKREKAIAEGKSTVRFDRGIAEKEQRLEGFGDNLKAAEELYDKRMEVYESLERYVGDAQRIVADAELSNEAWLKKKMRSWKANKARGITQPIPRIEDRKRYTRIIEHKGVKELIDKYSGFLEVGYDYR